jgi:hypothetical protein
MHDWGSFTGESAERTVDRSSQLTLSVALCTYDGARYLPDQLSSLIRQTRLPDEIVIRDDGSTDDTLVLIREFQATAPVPVRILTGVERLGVAANFMTCARACSGEIILFCDQDDVWLETRVEAFRQAFRQQPEAVAIFGNAEITDESLNRTGQTLWQSYFLSPAEIRLIGAGEGLQVLARHVFVTGAALGVQKAWLDTVPDPAPGFFHDEWLGWFAAGKLRLLDQTTLLYRQHARQQTGLKLGPIAKLRHLIQTLATSVELLERDQKRFQGLAQQLEAAGLPERASLVRRKIAFIRWRLELSTHPVRRLLAVLKRLLAGDYHRFTIAHRSVVKDILATPARERGD